MELAFTATRGEHALATDWKVTLLADDAPLSILADVAVGNARSAHSGESVSVVLCPTVVDTLVVLLELRHWADGRISSCKASSKAIGFMSLRTGHHTGR